ncbi:MAG: aminodeoxychorismate lyase [Oceanospirillales bacterium]|nr:aminodeoxychorismate lyase [Oceanospirillales bacterium]MBR9887797.1 aminodeoxychorismate lyase [Oceanospirillales bacterium]
MRSCILINGLSEHSLPVTDRGFAYGHGLFETIAVNLSAPVAWQAHLDRLRDGAKRLAIPLPVDIQHLLEQDLAKLLRLQQNAPERQVLKITITRGCGGRGYAVDEAVPINRIVQLTPFPEYPDQPSQMGITVTQCQTRLALSPQLAGIKHLNRLEQVLARAEWNDTRIREGVVLDSEGFLAEGTMSNLFWLQGGVLYTPQLDRCGIKGIIRQRVISIAEQCGIAVSEGLYTPDALADADEIFVCNSIIAIWPVTGFITDQKRYPEWSIGPITRMLQSRLLAEGIY